MTAIGVTGGIGSGKSYVCAALVRRGYPVYDCDAAAKRLMQADPVIQDGLRQLFGTDVYLTDGTLNKPLLAQAVFSDADMQQAVNGLVHPHVKDDFMLWRQHQSADLAFLESAILYESGLDDLLDGVLLVTAPRRIRLKRAMQRDHTTAEAVTARMKSQLPQRELRARARWTLVNDGCDIQPQLDFIIEQIKLLSHQQKH